MGQNTLLAQSIADRIVSMITVEKRFVAGDKLPNENIFSQELNVSRNTLREAIRILNTYGILEIKRGKGTYVTAAALHGGQQGQLDPLSYAKIDTKDLFEMRLILEPEAAYLAALRGNDVEIAHIVALGQAVEKLIARHEDRTKTEYEFHSAIAQATHNKFMNKMIPLIYEAIFKGVALSEVYDKAVEETLADHRMIIDFMTQRNAEGARNAMRIHILHAINSLKLN